MECTSCLVQGTGASVSSEELKKKIEHASNCCIGLLKLILELFGELPGPQMESSLPQVGKITELQECMKHHYRNLYLLQGTLCLPHMFICMLDLAPAYKISDSHIPNDFKAESWTSLECFFHKML